MRKLFVLLFLVTLAACSKDVVPTKVSQAPEPRTQTLPSIQPSRDSLTRQPLVADNAEVVVKKAIPLKIIPEAAEIPDEEPIIEVYQVVAQILVKPEILEPEEPEFIEPVEPEFVEPVEPEFIEPVEPEFLEPVKPEFLESVVPEPEAEKRISPIIK